MSKGNKITESIGDRICRLRTDKNVTQQEVATALYVDRVTVSQWEQGTRDIKSGSIIDIAEYFGVSTDYLLGLTNIQNPDIKTREVSDRFGLGETALNSLSNKPKTNHAWGETMEYRNLINLLLSEEHGKIALRLIFSYFFAPPFTDSKKLTYNVEVDTVAGKKSIHSYELNDEIIRVSLLDLAKNHLIELRDKRLEANEK
jgi:transcriptional regulator with XRE-family HTH domain